MQNLKIAAQLYTVRDLLKDKSYDEVKAVLTVLKNQGYEAVQISGIGKITKEIAMLYKEICDALELDICATHVSLQDLQEDLDWIIKYHKLWGCNYVGIGAMPSEMRNEAGAKEFVSICNEIGKGLLESGIHLIYHNHKFEFEKFNGKTLMDTLFEGFVPEYVQFEIDTYWVQAGGADPTAWIKKVDGRMDVVHLKDMAIKNDEQQFSEIGGGNLNWTEILEACRSTGVVYAAVEQDAFFEDPLESLGMSRSYLRCL